MATILSVYTRMLALLSVGALAIWGWLAAMETALLREVFQSDVLVWAPALWFLYLALRFGHSRSVARFYARGLTAFGRTRILTFGLLALGSLLIGLYVGLPLIFPETALLIGQWGSVAAFAAASLYIIAAHFGSRNMAFSTGLVELEGQPVIRSGAKFNPGEIKYPYRG